MLQYKKCLELNPHDIKSAKNLAFIYTKIDRDDLALDVLKKGLVSSPNSSVLHTEIAKVFYKQKDYENAIDAENQSMQLGGDSSLIKLKIIGISYFQLGQHEKAIEYLSYVDENSESNETMNYYIGACYIELGDLEKGELFIKKAINQGVSNNLDNFYTSLAIVYEKQENYKESINAYKLAYQYSKNKILLYHLARNYYVYYKDKTVAMKYYQKYLNENDTNNAPFINYSEYRLSEIKMKKHFDLDTLN